MTLSSFQKSSEIVIDPYPSFLAITLETMVPPLQCPNVPIWSNNYYCNFGNVQTTQPSLTTALYAAHRIGDIVQVESPTTALEKRV